MKISYQKVLLCAAALQLFCTAYGQATQRGNWFNVKTFGAAGNGKTIDTRAINNAISAAAQAGGGTVYFPAGSFLSYSIHLKSNISLFLDQGCRLVAAATTEGGRYDEPEPGAGNGYQDYGHSHWHNSLLWGEQLENLSIAGTGIIDGKALSRGFYSHERWDTLGVDPGHLMERGSGNKTIALKLCRNVTIKDITILNGGHFGVLATGVDNMTIDNLRIDTNRDGMDIDCCSNVRISNCTVNAPNDDAICLKSSYALGYAKATENVTITNCQVSGFDVGTLYDGTRQRKLWRQVPDQEGPAGRIKFGTESNGGFRNIAISNCVFEYCRGLALETVDGAALEDVSINNIVMRDVSNAPLFLRLGARMRGPRALKVGTLQRVTISNVTAYNADSHFASIIAGIPGHAVADVELNHIRLYYRQIDSPATQIQRQVPEREAGYPEPHKMGVLPSYGFFVRHAENIRMHDVQVRYLGGEVRPPLWIEDVNGLRLRNVDLQPAKDAPLLMLNKVSGLDIKDSRGLKDEVISTVVEKSL